MTLIFQYLNNSKKFVEISKFFLSKKHMVIGLAVVLTSMPLLTCSENAKQQESQETILNTIEFTVKVHSGNSWGSGIIFCRSQDHHFVLTARHVLDLGSLYRVETADSRFYDARRLNINDSVSANVNPDVDVGFLVFQSEEHLPAARIDQGESSLEHLLGQR